MSNHIKNCRYFVRSDEMLPPRIQLPEMHEEHLEKIQKKQQNK